MVVYADVLVCINLLITYIFIVCVRVFTSTPSRKWGVAVASLLGGISSLVIFFPDTGVILSVIYKLVTGGMIVFLAFFPRRMKIFVKLMLSFFGVSFLFGGAMFALEMTVDPHNIFYYNGTVYFDMTIPYLIGVVFIIYGSFLAFDYFLTRHAAKNEIYDVLITFRDVSVTVRGMVDTGNNMRDGLSGNSVFVGELSSLMPLFSQEEREYLKNSTASVPPASLSRYFRLLPCGTVSGGGILPGIVPDKVFVRVRRKYTEMKNITLAITGEYLSSGEYNMLLNKNIYDSPWKEISDEKHVKYSFGENKG